MSLRAVAMIACATSALLSSGCSESDTAKAEVSVPPPEAVAEPSAPVVVASPPTPQVAQASFAGTYQGPFDGGPGTVTITGDGPRYRASIVVVGEGGCVAEIDGAAQVRGDVLSLRKSHPDVPDAGVCEIEMTRSGRSLAVSNTNCSAFHGMGCTFTGTARRTQ